MRHGSHDLGHMVLGRRRGVAVPRPGVVAVLTLALDEAAEAHRAMDERRAIKALLRP